MPQGKQGWDTRAWLVGILGGAISGNIAAWVRYPLFTQRFSGLPHWADWISWISWITAVFNLLALPGILSGIAHRKGFVWGLLPIMLFIAAVYAEEWAENGLRHVAKEFWWPLAVGGGCLLLSSGPVSLIRYGRVRAQRKRQAALASLAAQREAASIPREGVWPPPPDYRQ